MPGFVLLARALELTTWPESFLVEASTYSSSSSQLLDGPSAATFAKIALMMRRVHIDDADLQLAEQALRSLANRYRESAARQLNPIAQQGSEDRALDCERIAERMRPFREVPGS